MTDTEIFGYVEGIVYRNEESGFTVAKLKEPKKQELTYIVGALSLIQPGESLRCRGNWKRHLQYGIQFEVTSFTATAPADVIGIQKYLESGMIKGIGRVYAERIVNTFGINTLEIIDQQPDSLLKIEGLGPKRVEKIKTCWYEQRQVREVMVFLRNHQVSPSLAQKIFRAYGEESILKVQTNPYGMAKDIFGIGFKTADQIGRNLGIPDNAPVRIDAGIEHTLWELSHEGNVCYPYHEFIQQAIIRLNISQQEVEERIIELIKRGDVVTEQGLLWIRSLYLCEIGIARELARLLSSQVLFPRIPPEPAITWAAKQWNISFAKEQAEAIATTLKEKVHIITGGPGTGKSTITKAILSILQKRTKKILLAAPTGRAAKRITEITGMAAFTIHSLLEMSFEKGGFKKNRQNPLDCHVLIVDEASMIDTQLMHHLLKAVPPESQLIIIGDSDQLPSVGPGNVLKDLITSNCIPTTRLKVIFRQAAHSRIIVNAHRINGGEFPDLSSAPKNDFFFIHKETPEEVLQCIVELVSKRLPATYRFHRFTDIQVLAPMKKGVIGIENLNVTLQQILNPSDTPLRHMGRQFHIGDKVMQIRNNYQKDVFNGDVGRVSLIDEVEHYVEILFETKRVRYEFSEIDELTLAYAVSIHKYQGSESPCIVIPIHTTHFKLLHRNLIYTGITRGKKLVVLVGTKKALAIAIKNDEIQKRHTNLHNTLRTFLPYNIASS
jgi:exodeoxyribonuclease V alpha subunit